MTLNLILYQILNLVYSSHPWNLRSYLIIVFEKNHENQFLKMVFKNCFIIFCKIKVCLGTLNIFLKFIFKIFKNKIYI